MAGYLLGRGATIDITIAAALGDMSAVRHHLSRDHQTANFARPSGKRPLSAAAAIGATDIVRLLLDHGANPVLPEGRNCPKGHALWTAAAGNHREIAEMLLDHGADPNAPVESCGTPSGVPDRDMRALMYRYGGKPGPLWFAYERDADGLNAFSTEELIRENNSQEGGLYKAAIRGHDWNILWLLMARNIPFPTVFNPDLHALYPDMTRRMLENGMNPDIPNWQRCTPLHAIAARLGQEKTETEWEKILEMFLFFGASINAIDEEYRSTPLAWAARCGATHMARRLLYHGADPTLAGAPWATPLAWARRRAHHDIVNLLTNPTP
jgi:ankyrin repeat protein